MPATEILVVAVPDFSGPAREVFEWRALFLLASWLEGRSRGRLGEAFSLELACIGSPPRSVQRLAELGGVTISLHPPIAGITQNANKLRGLEAVGDAPRLFLIDVDTLIVGSLDGLKTVGGEVSAAVEGQPRVPETSWRDIYHALHLPPPREKIRCLRAELGLPLKGKDHWEGREAEFEAMMPYYNSGAVLTRRGGELRALWESSLRWLQTTFVDAGRTSTGLIGTDQAGLAVAIHDMRVRDPGAFAPLPDSLNVRPPHLIAGRFTPRTADLFHATGAFKIMPSANSENERLDLYELGARAMKRWNGHHPHALERELEWWRAYLRRLADRWLSRV